MSDRVIVVRIFVSVPDPSTAQHEQLVDFYDDSYAREGEQAQLYSGWRALGAQGKANHVIELCAGAGVQPKSTLEVGCGDGALLCELYARDFGGAVHGVEITKAAVRIAGQREEIASVELYDGEHLPHANHAHDLGIVSHVLEHVPDPVALLKEVGRACDAVVMEVPLEENLSAKRAGKRKHADEVGHLQRFDKGSARAIVAQAGMRVAAELEDPLPLEVHRFFARTRVANALAIGKWGARRGLHRLAPALARKLFTVHYACLCLPCEEIPAHQAPPVR
jgi:SAM-dependent methyltransferase